METSHQGRGRDRPRNAAPSHLVRRYLDDLFVGAGAVLGGIGVWLVWPRGVWFYAAAWCVALGVALGRVK